MPITTAFPNSLKRELFQGLHNFDAGSPSDTFKLALIKANPNASYGASTTNYSEINAQSPQDEVPASGTYAAGGGTLTNAGVTLSGTTGFVDFDDISFTSATISADGCIIYNWSKAGKAVYVGDFGGTKTSTNGTFTVQFPAADSSNALLRLS